MNPPKMPIHIGDYHRDTGHLRAAGHGAYLLLMFHYWSTGGLPDDDRQLAAIARMTSAEWRKHKTTIKAFFKQGWTHKRIDYDLDAAREAHERRVEAGSKARAKPKQSPTNAAPVKEQSSSNAQATLLPLNHSNAADAANPEKQLFERGKEILGKDAGGLIAKLLKTKKNDVALARSAIEMASTKQNPREYIGAVIAGKADNANDQYWAKSIVPGVQ